MRSEDLLMSFDVVKTPSTFNINGLASNTSYWIKVLDDNGFDVLINSGNGCDFSTLNYDNTAKDSTGYNIVLERDGFYLYHNGVKETNLSGLKYSTNDSITKFTIESFPIKVQKLEDYITIYKNNELIAISEKSTIKD